MNVANAMLVKRITDDGLVEIGDHIEIGKHYLVDMDSIKNSSGFNYKKGKQWKREIINTVGDDQGWLPTELLEILKGD